MTKFHDRRSAERLGQLSMFSAEEQSPAYAEYKRTRNEKLGLNSGRVPAATNISNVGSEIPDTGPQRPVHSLKSKAHTLDNYSQDFRFTES